MQLLKLAAVALAIILIPSSTCMTLPVPEGQQAGQPEPCCTPDQWESGFGMIVSGSQAYITVNGRIAYDYTNQLVASNQSYVSADGKIAVVQRFLIDGTSQKFYMVDETTKKCSVSDMPSIPQYCVPPYLNYSTTVILGDPSERFSGLVFQLGSVADGFYSMVVTQNQCAPVSVTSCGQKTQVGVQSFYNFTLGIKDSSVFNIPPECTSAAEYDRIRLPSLKYAIPCTLFGPCWFAEEFN